MGLFKGLFKFLGGILVFFALGLLFVSVFGNSLVDSFPDYKDDIDDEFLEVQYDAIEDSTGLTRQQIEEACQDNHNDFCDALSEENLRENSPFNTVSEELNKNQHYFDASRNVGALLLIAGIVFYILGFGIFGGLRRVFFSGVIASVINYLFYRFALMGIVNNMLKNTIPDSFEAIFEIVKLWINSAIVGTISFIMVVGVISIILTIVFFIIKRK